MDARLGRSACERQVRQEDHAADQPEVSRSSEWPNCRHNERIKQI